MSQRDPAANAATASPLHPHEPEIPVTLDDEGRCRVCGLLVQLDEVVAALGQAVEALDIATDALAAGDKLPERAILTAKLRDATRELLRNVGAAVARGAW